MFMFIAARITNYRCNRCQSRHGRVQMDLTHRNLGIDRYGEVPL